MFADFSAPIPLDALSAGQRRLVERHLPLVHLTLGRLNETRLRRPGVGSHSDLFQEGSLALVEAVRTHDAARHGAFAPFAMARMRFSISRFLHEAHGIIRVPFITQRRIRRRRPHEEKDRHDPAPWPRVVRLSKRHRVASRPPTIGSADGSTTVGEQIRARYERAARRAVRNLSRSSRATPAGRRVFKKCIRDRWLIPEPDEKTPIRKLARSLDCPPSRVMRCEERFIRKVGRLLGDDLALQKLLRLSRRSPDGMRHQLTLHECNEFSSKKQGQSTNHSTSGPR